MAFEFVDGAHVASGRAGDWLVFLYEIEEGAESFGLGSGLRMSARSADGEGVGIFAVMPTIVPPPEAAGSTAVFEPLESLSWHPGGGEATREEAEIRLRGGWGKGDTGRAGVLAAFSASAPWSLSLKVTSNDTPLAPDHVIRGSGAAFFFDTTGATSVSAAGLAYELTAPLDQAGWNHVEILDGTIPTQLFGVNHWEAMSFEGHFPNGYSPRGVWANTPVSSNHRYFGAFFDEPGTLRAEHVLARTNVGGGIGAVHIPVTPDMLPAFVKLGNYCDNECAVFLGTEDGVPSLLQSTFAHRRIM